MTNAFTSLPDYLFQALLEALRRDLRHEEAARASASAGSHDAFRHGVNARFDLEILQFLRPKTESRQTPFHLDRAAPSDAFVRPELQEQ